MKGRERRLDCPPALLMSYFFYCPHAIFLRTLLCCHSRSTSVLHFCLVFFLSLSASPILAAHFPLELSLSLNLQPAHLVGLLSPSGNCCLGTFAAIMPTERKSFQKTTAFSHTQTERWTSEKRRGGGMYAFFFFFYLSGWGRKE